MPRSPKTKTMANTQDTRVGKAAAGANTEVKNDLKRITSCFHHQPQHRHHRAASSAGAERKFPAHRNLFTQNFRWMNAKTLAEMLRNGLTLRKKLCAYLS